MAGIAILLDLWKKNRSFNSGLPLARSYNSAEMFSAAASFVAGTSFASRVVFEPNVAYCDAGAALPEDYISNMRSASEKFVYNDAIKYSTKEYNIQLKPLSSAFELRSFAITSLRSFLMFYLPLLEPRASMEDDDDDFLQESQMRNRADLTIPFKKSAEQIVCETIVVTTRRILERIVVHYVSQRTAWKLLKDVPRSAARKARREMPTLVYFFCVSRTTFRGHMLGVAASWLVQVGIESYRFFTCIFNSEEEDKNANKGKQVELVGQKVVMATIRCCSSLIFASIGAGIGATLFRPSAGQWIGCAAGDLAGPFIVAFIADQVFHVKF